VPEPGLNEFSPETRRTGKESTGQPHCLRRRRAKPSSAFARAATKPKWCSTEFQIGSKGTCERVNPDITLLGITVTSALASRLIVGDCKETVALLQLLPAGPKGLRTPPCLAHQACPRCRGNSLVPRWPAQFFTRKRPRRPRLPPPPPPSPCTRSGSEEGAEGGRLLKTAANIRPGVNQVSR
jgi:hypothetical protein